MIDHEPAGGRLADTSHQPGPQPSMGMRRASSVPSNSRRTALLGAVAAFLAGIGARARAGSNAAAPERRWYEAAERMKRLAESWGDQPYGAVLVLEAVIVGEGPSRVIKNNDPSAHAEREAIRDARRRLGRQQLAGSVLYSTSRPCSLCEAAAAEAGVSRMYVGSSLTDAGEPRRGAQ